MRGPRTRPGAWKRAARSRGSARRRGENSAEIRRRIGEACAWLGVELDPEANARKGPRISGPGSKAQAWVIPTNEELMIARHTGLLLGLVEARVQRFE